MNTDFGSLCGSLLAGITQARVMTDIESVRTAEFYAQHPLLKHMPVPRLRCSEVNLDVPIIIEDVEDLTQGLDPGAIVRAEVEVPTDGSTDEALDDAIRYAGIELKPREVNSLRNAVQNRNAGLRGGPGAMRRSRDLTREIRESIDLPLREIAAARADDEEAPRQIRKLVNAFELAIQERVGDPLRKLNRVRVSAKTADIQRVPDSSLIVRLRLTVSEEGYEMTVGEDDDGNVVESLAPE